MTTRERKGITEMATNTGTPAVQERPVVVKLPPPSGRPEGKGLESITKGEGEPGLRRVIVPDLTKAQR